MQVQQNPVAQSGHQAIAGLSLLYPLMLTTFISVITEIYGFQILNAKQKTRALYNADCPICNSEMCSYAEYSADNTLPIAFEYLNSTDLSEWGVTEDEASRLLHVIHHGKLHVGFDAMLVLWAEMPRYRWLARVCRTPLLFQLLDWGYANVVARFIYWRHKRRGRLGLRTPK